jgi:hypothetical protein
VILIAAPRSTEEQANRTGLFGGTAIASRINRRR